MAIFAFCCALSTSAQTSVVTQHNDIGRTGQNTNETILTPSNVNSTTFGKLFSLVVDGYVYAQPLYVPGVVVPGQGTHNVLYIATEHDTVYAFDADTGGFPLWKTSFLINGATTVPYQDVIAADIRPEIGITGTPVIDPVAKTIYVVAKTLEGAAFVFRLHALDIGSGAEKSGSPVIISGSVPGTGSGSTSGTLPFNSKWENQRPGLLLLNGYVYVGFAAHGDNGPWHGWILSYNATNLQAAGVWCTSPNGIGSGLWSAGAGLSADTVGTGRIFVATGNGDFPVAGDVVPNPAPAPSASVDYGDSIVQLTVSATGQITPTDYFVPYNAESLEGADTDLGSGGILIPPNQGGTNPDILIEAGKQGNMYILNRDQLTNDGSHFCNGCTSDPEILEPVIGGIGGLWSVPAYWNGNVYVWGNSAHLRAYSLANSIVSRSPTSQSAETNSYPGATPVVSASGTTNGIVWAMDTSAYSTSGPAILRAYDATNVSNLRYASNLTSGRDTVGPAVKFAVPTVVNGKVYVGAQYEVDVYALLGSEPQAAAPTFTPGGGSYTSSVQVSLSSATPNALIFYTTNGNTPTLASTQFTGPITITGTTTINAIAIASGVIQSAVTSATFTYPSQTPAPEFSPAPGTYTSTQTVQLVDPGATIYYTLDGSAPTHSSPIYSMPITVSGTTTINAFASESGNTDSGLSGGTFTINPNGSTSIDFGNGFSIPTGMQFNGSTDLDDSRLQLTNGQPNEAGSAFFTTPMDIRSFTTDFTFQLSDATADGITFTIQDSSSGPTALGGVGGSLGYGGTTKILNSVAIKFDLYSNSGEGDDSTGLYTNGANPTMPAVDLTPSGIDLDQGDTIAAHITYDGTTLTLTLTDAVINKTFTTSWTVNIPAVVGANTAYAGFTGGSGGGTASQKIGTWTFVSMPQQLPAIVNLSGGITSPAGLQLNGSAKWNQNAARLTLTSGTGQAGSAFYKTPVSVQAFTNNFSFQLTNPAADGFTFTIQSAGPTALGAAGANLGYGTPMGASIAVKFDLYNDAGEGVNSTGEYSAGAKPTVPSLDMTSSGVNLHSGDLMNVQMNYDGTTLTMTITDAITGASFSTSWALNIPSLVGGSTAYVGFTASTGGLSATQEITNWSYAIPPTPIQFETENLLSSSVSSGPAYIAFAWSGFANGQGTQLSSTGVGNNVAITLNVPAAGTYDVKYAVKMLNSRGIAQLAVNGTNLGPPEDQYAATNVWQEFDLGTVNLAAGNQVFKFTVTGKNASSSGYTLTWDYIKLTPKSNAIQFETESLLGSSVSSGPAYGALAWTGFTNGQGTQFYSTKAGQNVAITLNVPAAGTYDVKYAVKMYNSRGIAQLAVNGTNLGPPEDQYAATNVWQEFDLGTVALGAGNQVFKFTVTGQNAASSGASLAWDYIKLTPQ
jgi:Legume lectin domain/Chitobiase/beta-hexosaminidase C-terminal domain